MRRSVAVLATAAALLTAAAAPAAATPVAAPGAAITTAGAAPAAATTPCRPGADSPVCQVWTGKVTWVPDGDTPIVKVGGAARSIRLIGVQAMEQSVYSPTPAKRRGECHALAATARVEYLVKAGGGTVRLTAQHAGSISRGRPLRSIAVKIKGTWVDIGLDLIRNGYALWLPIPEEWAWNPAYRTAAQLAARDGRNLYDTDACGAGPHQAAKLSLAVNYDAEGNDNDNINGEWIEVRNGSGSPLPLGGWWVRDSGLRRYTFPAGSSAPAGGSVFVHVGSGTATATDKYWGEPAPVFVNPTFDTHALGDGGYLFDPKGDLRAWKLYPCVVGCAVPAVK